MSKWRTASRPPRLVWALLLAVAALALVAAGCGGDDDEGGGEAAAGDCNVWVLLPDSATSPRWEADDRRFFEEAFDEAGVDYNIVNAEGSGETQQSQAEQAITDGANVLVLTSNDAGSGGSIIDTAKDADVKVVEYDRFNTGSSGGDAYVSFDNVKVGATMAEVLEPLIDDLGKSPAEVVMLNGGEEDNNAFLFRDGYAETVEARADAGDWNIVADQFVPGWGGAGEGQTLMEQILVDAGNKVDAVFAANDNLAQQSINALEAAGLTPGPTSIPISGQDASVAGMQNLVLGKQAMSVYKPIEPEAKVAAAVALALCAGDEPDAAETDYEFEVIGINSEDGKPAESADGEGVVPYIALTPIGVTVDNIADTVIADGFRTVEEICTGDSESTDWCQENA